jgi:hypothetical protein
MSPAFSPVSLFLEATSDIDQIFSVSQRMKDFFVSSLQNAAKEPGLQRSNVQVLNNASATLQTIGEGSIKEAEKDILSLLYRQGLISVVSAEQILKASFNGLLRANLEKIKKFEKINIDFQELKDIEFKTDREFWVRKLIEELYGGKNPQEKLNFQNIKAIEDLLLSYFNISLAKVEGYDKVAKQAHYFYQLRHILVHNAGYIDQRFIDNLKTAEIKMPGVEVGEKLDIRSKNYEGSKKCFFNLFVILESLVESKNLIVGEDDNLES